MQNSSTCWRLCIMVVVHHHHNLRLADSNLIIIIIIVRSENRCRAAVMIPERRVVRIANVNHCESS